MGRTSVVILPLKSFKDKIDKKNYAVFGAKGAGKRVVYHLRPFPPKCYFDNDPDLSGTKISGVLVMKPELEKLERLSTLIITTLNYFPLVYSLQLYGMLDLDVVIAPVELIYGFN